MIFLRSTVNYVVLSPIRILSYYFRRTPLSRGKTCSDLGVSSHGSHARTEDN
jgi:hypothetical protein